MWSSRLLMDAIATSVFHNRWTFKVLSFPMMDWCPSAFKVIVSSMYSCEALNPRRSSFPNSASHVPLLGKISNVPCIWIPPTTTIPVHVPSERTSVPFAILRTFDERWLGESCFFIKWNILLSIAFTIPPSSNIALTLTSSPSIPIRSISFSNETLAFPTVYSSWQSIMSHESYMLETVVTWGLLFSPRPAAIAAGNTFLFSPRDFGAQREVSTPWVPRHFPGVPRS